MALITLDSLRAKRIRDQSQIQIDECASFNVFDDHYCCFGYAAHGDVFDWLEKQPDLSFQSAIGYLGGNGEMSDQTPRLASARHVQRAPNGDELRPGTPAEDPDERR
jgi:hypothetical protein